MKLILLLFLLCLLINNSKCGPEIFKFTSEPESQTVNAGGSVTLSCVATGRSGITYSWYKLDTDFSIPPSNSDLISGKIGTTYVVQAADVDESGEERLFQCKATAGNDVILSRVATVLYKLPDSIAFVRTGDIYSVQRSIPNDVNSEDVFLYILQCNTNELNLDDVITNGEPYDVQWFKSGEIGRVENNHKNMWTCYNKEDFSNYKVTLGDTGYDITLTTVKKYDLLIFNVQTTDAGIYSCKAVSRVNKQEVLLGTTDLTVGTQNDVLAIIPKEIIAGYMILAVDSTGKISDVAKVGDKVLLMCGAACRTSSGSWDPQYQWKDSIGNVILANTREHIVTLSSTGLVSYSCEILNSECASKLSSAKKTVTMTVGDADFDPTLQFTFSKSPPEYMWYDTSDNSKSHDPFEIGCEGSYTSGNTNVNFVNSVLRVPNTVASVGDDVVYDFGSSFTSDKSGVYQCVMFNAPDKVVLYQQTTNVIITALPSAAITSKIISVSSESTATFTCTVGGYPVESVTITGPNNLNLDCMTTQTSGDVSCSSTDQRSYVVNVQNFKLEYAGDYTCTVNTEWYKADNTAAIQNSAQEQVTLSFESTTTLTASANPANKGTTVTLTCTVKGNPAPTTDPVLTKTGDSSNVVMTCSGTSYTKVCEKSFSSVEFTDAGDYTCSGENTIDGVKKKSSSQLTLEIVGNAEATLTQNPTGPELDKGSSVTFTCNIEGNPLPTKLNFKKGNVVLKSYDAAGGTDNDIITTTYDISYVHDINTLVLDDTGNYICEGENSNGGPQTDEDSTILTVISDVVVTMASSTTTPTFGTAFTITCTATGGRKPHSVELQHGGKAIPASDLTCSSEGDHSEKCLYNSTADYTSGGMYSCTGKNRVAGNAEKEDTKSLTISVSKAVSVSLTPPSGTSVEITYGSTYTVTCTVDGGDKPHKVTLNIPGSIDDLIWQRNGQGDPLFTCSGEFELSCEYQISTIAYSNEDDYTCTGYNKLPGSSTDETDSKSTSLVVVKDVTVSLTVDPAATEINHGAEIKITCVADGGRIPFFLELSHTSVSSSVTKLVTYDSTTSTIPSTVTRDKTANTLTYIHTVAASDYEDNGSYSCLSKNRASNNAERDDEQSKDVIVVKNVTSLITAPVSANKGSQFDITCTAEGYRTPHEVSLVKDGKSLKIWNDLAAECAMLEFYKYSCVYDVASSEYTDGGDYDCISKNNAYENKEVTSVDSKSVSISQTVLTELNPSSVTELEWNSGTLTLTCSIEGGLKPHRATLKLPDNTVLAWSRNITGDLTNTLDCSGDNEMNCLHEILSNTFDSTGVYNCTGFNKIPDDSATVRKSSQATEIVVVKDVQATLTSNPETEEAEFGTEIQLTCSVVGGRTPFFLSLDFTNHIHTYQSIFKYDNSSQPGDVIKDKNSLEFVHVMKTVSYKNSGSYECTGKNIALAEKEKTNRMSKNIVVVKNVEVETISNIEADFGTSFTFTFKLNGGRSPHSVILANSRSTIFDWSENSNECTGTNELTCSKTVGDTDVNFGYDGDYTVTAKNRARNEAVVTAIEAFRVTVYKDVSATIQPSSDSTMTYQVDKTITCNVIGGLPPHKVDLILPNQVTKSWSKDGSGNSLTCTGTHEKTCTYTFTPEYNSDGNYKCVGYNKVRDSAEKQQESSVVQLTTVRSTEVTMSKDTISVLTNGTLDVNCTVVGKPLVDISAVSWSHKTLTDLDLSGNVSTVKGSQDDYTLVSTLSIVNPLTEYSGSFICNVQAENDKVITKSVVVSINNREFLDAPMVTHNGGEAVEQDTEMSITCHVKGFPRPSATLIYKNLIDGELSKPIPGAPNIIEISPTSTEFEFKLSTSCEYSQYEFICETQNTKYTDSRVLKESSSVEGPIVTGCENTLPVMIGGGVGGGAVFIAIVVIAVLCILKKVKSNRNKEYSPKNGTQIPNPAFGADPSYATVRETPGAIGYSHLNRPVGETTEDGYASIDQMNRQTGPGLVPAADAYATLDTVSNGRMGLKRQGSDAAYAALNRPAPGKEKRGVIRKYKPIASKPKSTFVPNKAADIELGEVNNSDQPEPTYATVNPATMKAKKTTSEKLPDLPPEVPIYGQGVINKHAPSEYADVTIPSSEYADITLPPPPPLPEGPVYSNMAETQGSVNDEDPVYAQVDMKSRDTKKPAAGEEEEDLPPDVPIYGTMGARTECDYPGEEEDPYATVEFVPKSQRKPPRPKTKEDASEGLYATITDFKVNSES